MCLQNKNRSLPPIFEFFRNSKKISRLSVQAAHEHFGGWPVDGTFEGGRCVEISGRL